ncbi:MAG: hypothetical protein N3A59_07630 [Thermodesulfovibrionales bacterium]|nr:hypothetical protein [Thermodesulfovibrionales bacterium]
MIKRLLFLYLLLFLMIVCSCIKRVEVPTFYDKGIHELLSSLQQISEVEANLSIQYELNDNLLQGDAYLSLSENQLELKVYYLGFLAGYFYENNGIVKSSKKIDFNKKTILIEGLKKSFLWWKIKDYSVFEDHDYYIIKNDNRRIVIDKKFLLPVEQEIQLITGDTLKITYNSPAKIQEEPSENNNSLVFWYQSDMRIQLANHLVKVKINSISYPIK